jgi:hypothetical protein
MTDNAALIPHCHRPRTPLMSKENSAAAPLDGALAAHTPMMQHHSCIASKAS